MTLNEPDSSGPGYNTNLREQRELAARIIADSDRRFDGCRPEDAYHLAQLVQALDRWLINGGALPRYWVATSQQADQVR
jgi:hypothetical protein